MDSSKDYGFYFPKPFQNILVCETVAEVDTCKTSSPSKDTPIADLINDKMWEYNASTRQWEEIIEIPLIYLDNKKPYYNKFTQKCWMKDIDDKYSDIYLIYGLREMVPLNYHMNIPMVITYCSDGSIQPYTQSTYKGEETQLTENRFVREGYIFTGWQDKDKKPYVDKAIVTFYRNTDLYAQWEELNVLIDHDNNYICDEKGNYIEYDDKT